MKKVLFILIASFAFCGSILAQESHYQLDYHSYNYQSGIVAAIMIDGQYVTEDNYDLNSFEVGAFVGDEVRGYGFITNKYVVELGHPYPVLDGMPVYYTDTNENVMFKLYDHSTGIEYEDCEILYVGELITIRTGEDHFEGWRDPWNPIILSFSSPTIDLELSDTGENTSTIEQNNSNIVNVTLAGRTLCMDGYWNTLCLPFSLELEDSPLEGAILKELDTVKYYDVNGNTSDEPAEGYHKTGLEDGTLYLNFKDAEEIVAGTPYIIKWDGASDIEGPVFNDVTIDNSDDAIARKTVDFGVGQFLGTYDWREFTTVDESILFLGEENTLCYPQPGPDPDDNSVTLYPSIGAFRAYFVLTNPGSVRAFRLNFGDGEETGITTTDFTDFTDAVWYTIDGRKLDKAPTRKGLYIHNGRKKAVR